MKSHVFGFALLSAINIVAGISAHAQTGTITRSFVSSTGVDGNSCMIAAPCASFAYAYTKVGANGIIAALDPGKYGPITITGPVTINGNGWSAITGPAGGDAINITAASGNVTLTGLELDGAGTALHGIYQTSALSASATLNIRDCVVSNFLDSGIAVQPTGLNGLITLNLLITNTSSLNNLNGIKIDPSTVSVQGTITGSTAANNSNNGFDFEGLSGITLLNSLATQNSTDGIYDDVSPPQTVVVRDTAAIGSGSSDIKVTAPGSIHLYRNTVGSLANSNIVYSDGTNDIQIVPSGSPILQGLY
jgi:hypothetical protein